MSNRAIEAGYLGRVSYEDGLALQAEAAGRIRAAATPGDQPDTLLLLEHPPVITLGKNADDGEIVAPAALLEARGARVHRCDRGGKVTYHGPGQLVGYPILQLKPDRCDVGRYVAELEETIVRTLACYGVAAGRFPGYTGVWVDVARPDVLPEALAGDGRIRTREGRAKKALPPPSIRKIAAIGVHLARWITTHGFSFNIHTDLSYYDLIVPCGIREFGVTSLAKVLGREIPLDEVAGKYLPIFCEVFDRQAAPLPVMSVRLDVGGAA